MSGRNELRLHRQLPKLRQLFDRWSAGSVLLMGALKFLQFIRLLGARAKVNGWRKVSAIFLHRDSAKFTLTAFRLDYADGAAPTDFQKASDLLAQRFAEYLHTDNSINWAVEPGEWSFARRKLKACDLIVAENDGVGRLTKLTPYWDLSGTGQPRGFSAEQIERTLNAVVRVSNELRGTDSERRGAAAARRLKRWVRREARFNYMTRWKLHWLLSRVMQATFLFCRVTRSAAAPTLPVERLALPDFRNMRHPGWGTLSVEARFTADFREVDLWCQFNHAAVDGAPMQEWLGRLKKSWGRTGEVIYPALGARITRPEVRYAGDGVFHALLFADFQDLLAERHRLNRDYPTEMAGNASVAGLLMWNLTRHEFFRGKKILLPVDAGVVAGERQLELLVIRPRAFPDFIAFQREMNLRMRAAREGNGASSEFLELCALLHPFFYHLARRLMPGTLHEIMGTVGLSLIREAEIFISPLTAFQINGFMAIGEMSLPTADGRMAAPVCISGSRSQIRCYLEALRAGVPGTP